MRIFNKQRDCLLLIHFAKFPMLNGSPQMATKLLDKSLGGAGGERRLCTLKPMTADLQEIQLSGGRNIVGRRRENAIKDKGCSKRQLELDVDLEKAKVKVRVLGLNPCSVNGLMALQNTEFESEHGDVLELVYGRLPFEVVFKPPIKELREEAARDQQGKAISAEATTTDTWDAVENGKMLVFTSAGVRASEKIAAYDMDGTLIRTKSGNVFPKNTDDWELYLSQIPGKLKQLHEEGFKICIFTNQSGIGKGKVNVDEFKQKIRKILTKLGVPVQVFIAIGNDYHRKPRPGMWSYMRDHKNGNVKLNASRCFFVGDAAGRPEVGTGVNKRRKDHSLADRLFAHNVGISFYTPEEHFLNAKLQDWTKLDFNPHLYDDSVPLLEPEDTTLPSEKCEMIVMVGLPGSGKSHFAQKQLVPHNYTVANADTLGSVPACLKACERALSAGKSCVVDNTNVDVEARKKFVALAKQHNVPCRCFVMNPSLAQTKHNIVFRELTDSSHSKISDMVFNMLKKKYRTPTLAEGFTEIVKVNIKPTFSSANEEQLYKLYLVEK